MDENRFDDITIAIAEGETRRTILRRLFGGSLAAAVAATGLSIGVEEAEARRNCRQTCRRKNSKQARRRCRQRCKNRPQCTRNNQCTSPQICGGGACTGGGLCTTDAQCSNGQTCVNGRCIGGGSCKKNAQCISGQVCMGGKCHYQICPAVTRTECANEPGTCGPAGSQCVCLQEAGSGGRVACSDVSYADCTATPVCDPANPATCPAGWLCTNNPCCPGSPRCSPPCGVSPV